MPKISALPPITTPDNADESPIVDTSVGSTKKFSLATIKTFLLTLGTAKLDVSAPQGFLVNGKIVRTVSSNNITVAIKTLSGGDPSTSDPVYVRIGDTVRSITAALSVTKNAGTNWMNAGSASLATLEVDYFVYLGYNSTAGVTIGFSRIPYATTYGDFNTTSTDERYAAISNITGAASTDQYENVGRFNAILSASSSYNWSVPGTSVIVNRPVFETRILTYVPTWTASSNPSIGNAIRTARYFVRGRQFKCYITTIYGSTTSFGSGEHFFGMPFTHANNGYNATGSVWAIDVGNSYYSGATKAVAGSGQFQCYNSASAGNAWSNLVPFTWGNGDQFSASIECDLV